MKRFIALVLAVLMILTLAACGSKDKEENVVLKIGHVYTTDSVNHLTYQVFADKLAEYSGGTLTAEIYPSSQLGTELEMIEGTSQGTLDITMSSSNWGSIAPAIYAVGLPYMYTDTDAMADFVENGGGWEIIGSMFEGSGVKALSFWVVGAERSVMSKDPIYSIDDFEGLKIRAPEVDLYVSTFKAMGANPTPIALAETYTSLQSGVVDAVEMGPEYMYTNKFYEVCGYYTMTRHFVDYGVVGINEETYNKLSDAQKEALTKAVADMEAYNRVEAPKANVDCLEKIIAEGAEIIELEAAEYARFVESVQPIYEKYANDYGEKAAQYIEAATEFANSK